MTFVLTAAVTNTMRCYARPRREERKMPTELMDSHLGAANSAATPVGDTTGSCYGEWISVQRDCWQQTKTMKGSMGDLHKDLVAGSRGEYQGESSGVKADGLVASKARQASTVRGPFRGDENAYNARARSLGSQFSQLEDMELDGLDMETKERAKSVISGGVNGLSM